MSEADLVAKLDALVDLVNVANQRTTGDVGSWSVDHDGQDAWCLDVLNRVLNELKPPKKPTSREQHDG